MKSYAYIKYILHFNLNISVEGAESNDIDQFVAMKVAMETSTISAPQHTSYKNKATS